MIKYRKAEEMKDSGTPWLGEISKEWDVKKLKHVLRISSHSKHLASEGKPEGPYRFYTSSQNKVLFRDTFDVEEEAIVLGTGGVMSVHYQNAPYSYSNHCLSLFDEGECSCLRFIYYSLVYRREILNDIGFRGIGLKNLERGFLSTFPVSLPLKEEQQKIANYLDIKTAQFDRVIEGKEKLIAKLEEAKKSLISEVVTGKVKIADGKLVERDLSEMKDSGVEWLGMVPREWEIKKIKHVAKLREKKTKCNDSLKYIGLENIEAKTGKYLESKGEVFIEGVCNTFKKNDVLFGKLRPYLAKSMISHSEGYCSSELLVIESLLIDPRLLKHLLLDNKFISLVNSSTYGAKMPRANWSFIREIKMPLYGREEQLSIYEFIENYDSKVSRTKDQIKQQIQKLKQAKQSLISEAVTGKIDLRDWKINEGEKLQ